MANNQIPPLHLHGVFGAQTGKIFTIQASALEYRSIRIRDISRVEPQCLSDARLILAPEEYIIENDSKIVNIEPRITSGIFLNSAQFYYEKLKNGDQLRVDDSIFLITIGEPLDVDSETWEAHCVAEKFVHSKIDEAGLRVPDLDLSGLRLRWLPSTIRLLRNLRVLSAAYNRLIELPDWLPSLSVLDVSNNQLTELPESLGRISLLSSINAKYNRLTSLPLSLSTIPTLTALSLEGNPDLGLPPEILDTHRAPDILEFYFRSLRGARRLNEAKLILVGRGGVGKTCLINRLLGDSFNEREPETPGIEIKQWSIDVPDGDSVRLHVWDFGGQEILHATHQFFLTERTLYLLVLSGREGNLTQDAEYWLQLIKSFGGNSRVIIALNKIKQHPFDVNRGFLLEKYPFIAGFIGTDCKDRTGISELLELIRDQADKLEHRKEKFPEDWFAIKEQLATMEENFVSWERYQAICRSLGERDPEAQRRLASFLHILGIALNYRDDARLRDTHVLNPHWVTEGIYSLLRSGQKDSYKGRSDGQLAKSNIGNVLSQKLYPIECHDFLLRLMEKFQLCFRLPAPDEHYLVPELLSENQPDIRELIAAPGLGFRFQYEVLPEGLLPRFIVQTHTYSQNNLRWRSGVVLEREGCRAVVRADGRERRVDILVTGNETRRRGLLDIIRDRLGEQHQALKGLTVEERVPLPGQPEKTIGYRHLLTLETEGKEWCRPEGSPKELRVSELLNGIDSPRSRAYRRSRSDGPMSSWRRGNGPSEQGAALFISYSHRDQKFLDELLVHLQPFFREGLTHFSDRQIAPGSLVLDEIQAALSSARVVLMLVTKDFLASDFLFEQELGPCLRAVEQGSCQILWVPVGHCAWRESPLAAYSPVFPPELPLASLWGKAKRDKAWVEICGRIREALGGLRMPST